LVTKLGFIGEGETDVMVVKSNSFQKILEKFSFEFVGARDAGGRGNLEKDNGIVDSHLKSLLNNGAEKIIIITDSENHPCISDAKASIALFTSQPEIIIIPKAMEAWFLSDTESLCKILNNSRSYIFPERTPNMPFEEINELLQEDGITKVKSKVKLTNRFLTHGFSIENASLHPNCRSAKYFLRKLEQFSKE
jgi:hypothetical protein